MRVFVVWEPVLLTDWSSPSTATLERVADSRASQYWDKQRLLSHTLGEHDRATLVWDTVLVFPPGVQWEGALPPPAFRAGPVVKHIGELERALSHVHAGVGM